MTESEEQADQEPPSSPESGLEITLTGCPDYLSGPMSEAARRALESQSFNRGALEINVIDEAEMMRQHERWLGDPTVTDVLTFDLRDETGEKTVDGQILVCEPVARKQAADRGIGWEAELLLYVVHGCMHLCGFDDHDEEEAAEMHREEDRILGALGWGEVFAGRDVPSTADLRKRNTDA